MAERVVIAKHKMTISFQLVDSADKSIPKKYPIRYSNVVIKEVVLEEIENPFGLCENWLVMEGTNWGMTKAGWLEHYDILTGFLKIGFEEIK